MFFFRRILAREEDQTSRGYRGQSGMPGLSHARKAPSKHELVNRSPSRLGLDLDIDAKLLELLASS